jgi:uncharacterized OsmC-like protein
VDLESVEVDLRARFGIAEKYGVGHEGSAMDSLVYVLEIKSSEPPERVQRVAALAERYCHASQSLKIAVPVTPQLLLNGEELSMADELGGELG